MITNREENLMNIIEVKDLCLTIKKNEILKKINGIENGTI